MKKLVLLTVFLPFIYTLFSQYPVIHYEHILDQKGLNDNNIKCLLQDNKGFIWIGGENGLYRYDGYNFVCYKDPPGCKNCPHFYPVHDIVEDNQGMLWTISPKGIVLFNPETERSLLLINLKQLGSPSLGAESSYLFSRNLDLMKDSRGNIWATKDFGIVRFSYKESCTSKDIVFDKDPRRIFKIDFFHLSKDTTYYKNMPIKIYEDSQGNIWAGCYEVYYVMRKGDTSFYRLEPEAKNSAAPFPDIYCIDDILQQNEDTFWILSEHKCYLMTNVKKALHESVPDGSALSFTNFIVAKDQRPRTIYKDRKNNLFLGADLDVFKLKRNNQKTGPVFESLYKRMLHEKDYSAIKYVWSILEDRTGIMWIGHNFFGIMKLNLNKSQFTAYNNLTSHISTKFDVNPIHFDIKGNLWIGTYGDGLYKIQKETNHVTRYDLGERGKCISCFEEIYPGILWLGTPGGVLEFNTLTGKSHDPFPEGRIAENLRHSWVFDMLKDQNQLYLTTFDSGLFVYDLIKKRLSKFLFPYNAEILRGNNIITSPIKLKNGEIIAVSAFHGINKINYDTEKGNISINCLLSDSVLRSRNINKPWRCRLFQDSHGSLWMVEKTGLYRIKPGKGEIDQYKLFTNKNFPEAWSIIEDNRDNLWIGTNYGLCRFNMNTGQIKNFTKEDGVPIYFHGYNSVCKDKDGRLYFGGGGGFYSFHPDCIKTNTDVPPIVITDFRLFKKSVSVDTTKKAILSKNITSTSRIELRYNQNDISFEFAALDYNLPLKNQYAYKLEGYQDEWIETDANNRIATYTNLIPGKYIFRVKGSNNDGVWNETGKELQIIIHPPPWFTWWAYVIYGLILLLLIRWYRGFLIRREKINAELRIKELEINKIEELDHMKSRFFANISHEFRTPLTLIQGPIEELENQLSGFPETSLKLIQTVKRNTRRLLNLINQLLDISKLETGKIKLQVSEGNLEEFAKIIILSFLSLAESKKIRYEYELPESGRMVLFDNDKVEKILTNLISNAFKFTSGGGKIYISLQYVEVPRDKDHEYVEIKVSDTGKGIPAEELDKIFDRFYQVGDSDTREAEGSGIGLALTKELADLYRGEINVESEVGKGSTFTVRLPVSEELFGVDEIAIYPIVKELNPEQVEPFLDLKEPEDIQIVIDQKIKSNKGRPVILIVEDNADLGKYISRNLESSYSIILAENGKMGLDKAHEKIPDLVISDVMMPVMDGIEMCKHLKADERTNHIPVIILTAKADRGSKLEGLETGADDYLIKPFDTEELKVRVKNLLEQRRKLMEKFRMEFLSDSKDIELPPQDQFIKRVFDIFDKHIADSEYTINELSGELNLSLSQVQRKVMAITSYTPSELFRNHRLKKAALLFRGGHTYVAQVMHRVGFDNQSYFTKCFGEFFKMTPTQLMAASKK